MSREKKLTFGEMLKDLREEKGLTQSALAKDTGVTRGCICRAEHSDILLSYPMFLKVQEVLGGGKEFLDQYNEAILKRKSKKKESK